MFVEYFYAISENREVVLQDSALSHGSFHFQNNFDYCEVHSYHCRCSLVGFQPAANLSLLPAHDFTYIFSGDSHGRVIAS